MYDLIKIIRDSILFNINSMKIIKYLIFLSILGGIFLIVYRNSDSKGLVRYWISFKMAVFIALILAGLIPNSVQASENDFPNNSSSIPIERIVKSLRAGFTSMNQRYLKPHKIDRTVFESDAKISKEYDKLVKSNQSLKKKFDALEKNISQGHFSSGREKGFQQWSNNIYYVGSKGDGARIYYRFVPNKFEVKILAYSNKAKQTTITKRMERLYDN
jgi:hypothetical protein